MGFRPTHVENNGENLAIFEDNDAFVIGKMFRFAFDAYFDDNITPLDQRCVSFFNAFKERSKICKGNDVWIPRVICIISFKSMTTVNSETTPQRPSLGWRCNP